ncbi:hypothetical protein V8F33_012462 [Rhypophila sp. PSN 637]
MPRQLPWKVNRPAAPKPPSGVTPRDSASRSPGPSSAHTPTARSTPKPKSETPRRSLGRLNGGRSPSTSPPPQPIPEEFTREGIDKDDRYRMVEDEFLAVAHDFTRHIHAAEYQRLKNIAKSQNEETIQNISRPVTGEMTELVKRRQAVLNTAKRQRKILGKRSANTDSEDDEDERDRRKEGGSSLQGLMDSPGKRAIPLISLGSGLGTATSPSRRRGVLIGQSQNAAQPRRDEPAHATELISDDDYDLDGGPMDWLPTRTSRPVAPPRAQTEARVESRLSSRPSTSATTTRHNSLRSAAQPVTTHHESGASRTDGPKASQIKQEDDDDHEDFFSRIRSRRAAMRHRSAGVKAESSFDNDFSIDDIPSFL